MLRRAPCGQLTTASLLLRFCLGFLWKTITLSQCQAWVFWVAAGFPIGVSSNSFCLKFSFSPKRKTASQLEMSEVWSKLCMRKYSASLQMAGTELWVEDAGPPPANVLLTWGVCWLGENRGSEGPFAFPDEETWWTSVGHHENSAAH